LGKLLRLEPLESFAGTFRLPASKPETQRAILAGTLAEGVSLVRNDLRSDETTTMKNACRVLGARIVEHEDHLEIHGRGRAADLGGRVIRADGSGLVFRTMTALACTEPAPTVVTGDEILCRRVMAPLFEALRGLGADVQCILGENTAPVVVFGSALPGGTCRLPGDISSQFITALLYAAPFAQGPIRIEVDGEVYSKSYITQTLASLGRAGIEVSASQDYRSYLVQPSSYRAQDVTVHEDYTSASYLLAACALYPGRYVLTNAYGSSMQGEYAIVSILEQLGLRVTFDRATETMIVDNPPGSLAGDFEIDVKDCPNIVPTLAAIGAYVDGRMRVVGARVTRFHKSPRVEAMAAELSRAGVEIKPIYESGICDGFEVRGAASYPGGVTFSSHGDHRIFMSLFVAGLRMRSANLYSGFEDVRLSFPGFFAEFAKADVRTSTVDAEPVQAGV
jgi:3-phosphoshikimate 1-carboxyvinyltransferase